MSCSSKSHLLPSAAVNTCFGAMGDSEWTRTYSKWEMGTFIGQEEARRSEKEEVAGPARKTNRKWVRMGRFLKLPREDPVQPITHGPGLPDHTHQHRYVPHKAS